MAFLSASDPDNYFIYFSGDLLQDFMMPKMVWLEPSKIKSAAHIILLVWPVLLRAVFQAVFQPMAVVEGAAAEYLRFSLFPMVLWENHGPTYLS